MSGRSRAAGPNKPLPLSAYIVAAILIGGAFIAGLLVRFADPLTLRTLARQRDPHTRALQQELGRVVAAFSSVGLEALPECAREQIMELRRTLRDGKCPQRRAEGEGALAESDAALSHKHSHEVILNHEELALVRKLVRRPATMLSEVQREALDALRLHSPVLWKRLHAELRATEAGGGDGADGETIDDDGDGDASPTTAFVMPPAHSATARSGGRGLRGWQRPFRFDPLDASNAYIYVGLISYRDPQCGDSLYEAFSRAAKPERIMVGVVQQNRATDLDCFEVYCAKAGAKCRRSQVRVLRMKDTEAQGVMYARWLASTLWSGERYYLQVDAHSGFNYEWDDMVIASLLATKDERAVLSHHPPDMKLWPNGMGSNVINICKYKWDDGGLPRFSSSMVNKKWNSIERPFPGIFIGAGMVFGRAQWIVDCPFDPNLVFLFSGEELLLSVCLFTKGWNIYNPDSLPVWHYYTRNIAGRENPSVGHLRDKSIKRLKYILGVIEASEVPQDSLVDLEPFLMGDVRTREQFFAYAGIDWQKKDINEPFCKPPKQGSAEERTKRHHHFETLTGLLPLDRYFFDTVPTIPPHYRSTAAPLEQTLRERKASRGGKNFLPKTTKKVQH